MTTDPSPAGEIAAAGPPEAAEAVAQIRRLLAIMAALRNPDGGCPWDLEQDFASIAPYTIEEAYEVADAIGRNDMADLQDELGDLLFQAVFHARMAEEAGAFDFADVARSIADKMERRHPHVFGGGPGRVGRGPSRPPGRSTRRRKEPRSPNKHLKIRAFWTMCRPPCPPCCGPTSSAGAWRAPASTGRTPWRSPARSRRNWTSCAPNP